MINSIKNNAHELVRTKREQIFFSPEGHSQ